MAVFFLGYWFFYKEGYCM